MGSMERERESVKYTRIIIKAYTNVYNAHTVTVLGRRVDEEFKMGKTTTSSRSSTNSKHNQQRNRIYFFIFLFPIEEMNEIERQFSGAETHNRRKSVNRMWKFLFIKNGINSHTIHTKNKIEMKHNFPVILRNKNSSHFFLPTFTLTSLILFFETIETAIRNKQNWTMWRKLRKKTTFSLYYSKDRRIINIAIWMCQ